MAAVVLLLLCLPLVVWSAAISNYLFPADCSDVYSSGTTLSGVYFICPTVQQPVEVYCEMDCSSSDSSVAKWTVIQRRMDGSVNFYRPWSQYKSGFGNKKGEYWLGLENIYQLTRKRRYELRVDMEDFQGGMVHARYSSFFVESEANGYRLHVSGYIDGGAGDSLAYHNGEKFSTFDKDQDSSAAHCAQVYLGAFWHKDCHVANPNGVYLWGQHPQYAQGVNWNKWKGYYYSLKSITMKIRPVT